MQFKGQLLLPDEPGPGLRVNLDVAAHHLALESDGGGLGAWPLEVVEVERLNGDVFALTVAGEPLQFVADDTIAFAYSGVPTIERVSRRPKTRSALRSFVDRIWNGPDEPVPPADPAPGPEPTSPAEPVSSEAALPVDRAPEHEVIEETLPPLSIPTSEAAADAAVPVIETDVQDEVEDQFPSSLVEIPLLSPVAEDLAAAAGCPAIRGDGRRCESPILTSSGYCYPHDPKRAFEDRYKAAHEARAQLKRDATGRLNRIYGRLDKAMRQVERGDLDPETAMAMAQLAQTMCAIVAMEEPSASEH